MKSVYQFVAGCGVVLLIYSFAIESSFRIWPLERLLGAFLVLAGSVSLLWEFIRNRK